MSMMGTRGNDWTVGVIIPAQNEEATIEKCVRSVKRALARVRCRTAWIVVVADHCTDGTARKARKCLGRDGEVVEVNFRSVGATRRAGVARILQRFPNTPSSQIWLANTDADSHVPLNWLSVQLELADSGVTGVAGVVQLDADSAPVARQAFREAYEFEPSGGHSHVHGANLSMRADAYLDVGGWRTLALGEDHCLWNRLKEGGWRTSCHIDSVVLTSARLVGRAPGGFANALKSMIGNRRAGA